MKPTSEYYGEIMKKPKVAVLLNEWELKTILVEKEMRRLRKIASVSHKALKKISEPDAKELIKGADAVITCWGTPRLTAEILDNAPDLKLIAHAAGSVKGVVSDEVWRRGIKVTTASPSIATSVAEFTLGMIITSLARVYQLSRRYVLCGLGTDWSWIKGLYNVKIGIVGAGFIGRKVISLLKPFNVEILLHDPFISKQDAASLGVRLVSLEKLMSESDLVSLHAPSLPSTFHMINGDNLKLMKPDSILINTARGAIIDEVFLIAHLRKNKRMLACLDVTDPEPAAKNSPLRSLENVILTPHIAGLGANLCQGDLAVNEVERFFSGKELVYPVTEPMLGKIA